MSFNDPGIPKKRRAQRTGNATERAAIHYPLTARFVDYGDHVLLTDSRGNTYSTDRVSWVSGVFGFSTEGMEKGPRPWQFDQASGKATVEGDVFMVQFLEGDPRRPILVGCVRSTKPNTDDDLFSAVVLTQDPNHLKWRLQQQAADGAQQHHVDVEAFASDGTVEIRVGGSTAGGSKLRIQIDQATGDIRIGAGSETQRLVFGDELLTMLTDIVTEINNVNLAIPTMVVAPTTAAFVIEQAAKITQSQANGAPLLSNRVKVD